MLTTREASRLLVKLLRANPSVLAALQDARRDPTPDAIAASGRLLWSIPAARDVAARLMPDQLTDVLQQVAERLPFLRPLNVQ